MQDSKEHACYVSYQHLMHECDQEFNSDQDFNSSVSLRLRSTIDFDEERGRCDMLCTAAMSWRFA